MYTHVILIHRARVNLLSKLLIIYLFARFHVHLRIARKRIFRSEHSISWSNVMKNLDVFYSDALYSENRFRRRRGLHFNMHS